MSFQPQKARIFAQIRIVGTIMHHDAGFNQGAQEIASPYIEELIDDSACSFFVLGPSLIRRRGIGILVFYIFGQGCVFWVSRNCNIATKLTTFGRM